MKFVYKTRTTLINICFVFCLVCVSVIYSQGGGFKVINAFLNTQNDIPIYSVATTEKKIALTFDVALGNDYTNEILGILDKNNVKATFFLVGEWVDQYPEKVKAIFEKGHEIGNHSNTHPHLTTLTAKKVREEISLTRDKIKKIVPYDAFLFRAPFGEFNSNVIKAAKKAKNFCIQWDVDSGDTMNPGTYFIYNNVMRNLDNGSIILLHNNANQTPLILDKIIKDLKDKGYSFVKVSDLIYKEKFIIDHTGRQRLME